MCNYKYIEEDSRGEKQIFSCCLENYFSLLASVTHEKYVLPIDKNGYCIFHSEDIEWKRRNNYDYWMQTLFKFLSLVDKGAIDYEHNGWKEFDLRGIRWLTSYEEGEESVILLDRLNYQSDMYLFFQGGIFYDAVRIRNCKSPETETDLSLCKFFSSVSVTDTTLKCISFDNSLFQNGLDIGKCVFVQDAAFYSMEVAGELCIASTVFKGPVNFSFSVFNTTIWMLNGVNFEMNTDFSSCVFNGAMEIENVTFGVGTTFKNAAFNDFCDFIECEYYEDMIFESENLENRMFNKSIRFNLNEDDMHGCFHFQNVNFFKIVEKDRKLLLKLQKDSKTIIGSGCIKYRVQSPVAMIKTDSINQNIIEELTYSFSKYFFHSSGFNLGVEFLEKRIDQISLFYFTDEDIELDTFLERLSFWGSKYWTFPSDVSELQFERSEAAVAKLDDYVSKSMSIGKIAVRSMCGYWNEMDTSLLFKAIPGTEDEETKINELIKLNATKIIMQIQNLNVHNGQVNILENAKDINIQQTVYTVPVEIMKSLELLIGKLSKEEIGELEEHVRVLSPDSGVQEKESLKEKVLGFMNRHGIAVAQSMTASCIYEGLRILLG